MLIPDIFNSQCPICNANGLTIWWEETDIHCKCYSCSVFIDIYEVKIYINSSGYTFCIQKCYNNTYKVIINYISGQNKFFESNLHENFFDEISIIDFIKSIILFS